MNTEAILLISIAAAIVIGIGAFISFIVGKRHSSSDDWTVGGRSLPLYVIAFTQYATAVGGGVLVAHVGIAYAWGFSIIWYQLFVITGLMILALFAGWLRRRKFATIPEVFTRLYGEHRFMTMLVGLAVMVVPFGWLATQFVAFASLFHEVTGIGITPLIIIMAIISMLFVLPGGLTSVAWSDFFFGVFMIAASVFVAGYAIVQAGGWGKIMTAVPEEITSLPAGLGAAGGTTILLWLFAILPGTLTNQLYYQRIFAAKSPKDARRGLYLTSVMILISGAYSLTVGLAVRSMNDSFGTEGREQAAGWFVSEMPMWLLAIYGAFLMATIVSTTGSALQSVVVNIVHDLRGAYVTKKGTQDKFVRLSRWCTVGVTIVAAFLATVFPNALSWVVATYAYSASILAVPFLVGIVMSRRWTTHVLVSYSAMIAGLIGCAGAHLLGTNVPYSVFGILTSLLAYLAALAVKRPQPRTPASGRVAVSVS